MDPFFISEKPLPGTRCNINIRHVAQHFKVHLADDAFCYSSDWWWSDKRGWIMWHGWGWEGNEKLMLMKKWVPTAKGNYGPPLTFHRSRFSLGSSDCRWLFITRVVYAEGQSVSSVLLNLQWDYNNNNNNGIKHVWGLSLAQKLKFDYPMNNCNPFVVLCKYHTIEYRNKKTTQYQKHKYIKLKYIEYK